MSKRTPKQQVIEYFGGVARTARILGLSSPAVRMWKVVPAERAIEIEIMTRGFFKAVELRPDLKEKIRERYDQRARGEI